MSSLEYKIATISNIKELEKFIEKNISLLDKSDWYHISKCPGWNNSLLDKYPDDLPWSSICTFKQLSCDIMDRHSDKLDWYSVSAFQQLSEEFIRKYVHRLSLNKLESNERIGRDLAPLIKELYTKYDDPSHHKVWDMNLKNSKNFCPKGFTGRYTDYNEKTNLPWDTEICRRPPGRTKNPCIGRKPKIDYDTLSKAELKNILSKRNVRVYYHDTLTILREKCRNSE